MYLHETKYAYPPHYRLMVLAHVAAKHQKGEQEEPRIQNLTSAQLRRLQEHLVYQIKRRETWLATFRRQLSECTHSKRRMQYRKTEARIQQLVAEIEKKRGYLEKIRLLLPVLEKEVIRALDECDTFGLEEPRWWATKYVNGSPKAPPLSTDGEDELEVMERLLRNLD